VNKLLILFLLFFSISINAQDSLTIVNKDSIIYNPKNNKIDNSDIIIQKFDSKFKTKYQSSDFQYEVKVAEKGIWDRFLEWLAYLFKKIFGLSDGVSSNAVNITLKTIAILIIVYVIYIIAKLILNKEGQWIFGKSTTKKVVSHEDIERNLKHIDFEKLIKETLKTGDKRLAIRYYYLWLLKRMSEQNIIDWNPEKTNSDYLYEIKSEKLKQDFNHFSYLYNYTWYGEFDIDDQTFINEKALLEKTLQSIK
jgi:hypothetical protein